jgi:Predicted aminopeptidases
MKDFLIILTLICLSISLNGQSDLDKVNASISQDWIKAQLEFLASDALQGRNTGSQGLEVAEAYIKAQFKLWGLAPVNGAYAQEVPFATFTPPSSSTMSIDDIDLEFGTDYILINGKPTDLKAPTQFVGHGNRSDLEGLDLTDKIVVSIAGDGVSEDPREWIGLTRDKRKMVNDLGGLALIEIYQSTSIPWIFLRRIGAQSQTTLDQGFENTDLPSAWLGSTDSLALAALKTGGQVSLAFDGVGRENFNSNNVMGMIPGTDPGLRDEYIVYSAHYDHVGVGVADADGDTIYNGARDNAVGTTGVMSLAKYFAEHPPRRSSIFVLFTAEEKGLLGSQHFTNNLPVSAEQIKYNFNIDNGGYNDTTIITVIGLTRTEAEADIQASCEALGLTAIEDAAKEQGLFDRSDNVNFAVLGIPAPTFSLGFTQFDDEIYKYYHRPGDEVETLNMDYIEKYVKAYILSSIKISNRTESPFWIEGDKYYDAGIELYKR